MLNITDADLHFFQLQHYAERLAEERSKKIKDYNAISFLRKELYNLNKSNAHARTNNTPANSNLLYSDVGCLLQAD